MTHDEWKSFEDDQEEWSNTVNELLTADTAVISALIPNEDNTKRAVMTFHGDKDRILMMLAAACQSYAELIGADDDMTSFYRLLRITGQEFEICNSKDADNIIPIILKHRDDQEKAED